MNFAGNNYAYISKKKVDKTKELRSQIQNNLQSMNVIQEEEEKAMDETLENIVNKEKIREGRRKSRSRSPREKKSRSRSGSIEINCDDELDRVYSDEEDIEEEMNIVRNAVEPKPGLFAKIGSSIRGLFSNNNKKEKKVLYSVSQARNNLKEKEKDVYEHEVDTNILSIKFEFLKDKVA